MNTKEFSDGFDTLLNSFGYNNQFGITNNGSVILDEYEKSLLLTQAQEEYIVSLYKGELDNILGFEKTEYTRELLKPLLKSAEISTKETTNIPQAITVRSKFYKLPIDILYIFYEGAILDGDTKVIEVKPITHDECIYMSENPFKMDNDRRVLKVDIQENSTSLVELISNKNITKYVLRYIKIPPPIVLENLIGVSINNVAVTTECILPSILHKNILTRAVELALQKLGIKQPTNNV